MQIVIDIPELTYESIINSKTLKNVGVEFIKNGTPLPKGHGRLVDENEILLVGDLAKVSTIIEADKSQ